MNESESLIKKKHIHTVGYCQIVNYVKKNKTRQNSTFYDQLFKQILLKIINQLVWRNVYCFIRFWWMEAANLQSF